MTVEGDYGGQMGERIKVGDELARKHDVNEARRSALPVDTNGNGGSLPQEEIEVRRSALPTETEGDPKFNLIQYIADGVRQEARKLFSNN